MLELSVQQFEFIRHILVESKLQKDVSILESQIRRSYMVKKNERLHEREL